jgi:hypothetical protein
MKQFRRITAIMFCGVMLGAMMSVFTASPATARYLAKCDHLVEVMERQAAHHYAKGTMSKAEFFQAQSEIAASRHSWGC